MPHAHDTNAAMYNTVRNSIMENFESAIISGIILFIFIDGIYFRMFRKAYSDIYYIVDYLFCILRGSHWR